MSLYFFVKHCFSIWSKKTQPDVVFGVYVLSSGNRCCGVMVRCFTFHAEDLSSIPGRDEHLHLSAGIHHIKLKTKPNYVLSL